MLTVFVIILAVFILLAPLIPQLDYFFNGPATVARPGFASSGAQTQFESSATTESGQSDAGTGMTNPDQLYIPAIGALAPVIEGTAEKTVDKGLWHRPATPTPNKGGNTVIVGHRFSYNPSVVQPFYHLDKIKIGDDIYLKWGSTTYHYTVTEKKVVTAHQVEVEAPTTDTRLTLYTCTPLWNPVDRLVVIAKPIGVQQ
jgi:LPXTG-site transpeptidase (sortase) family protein